jgi:hypothetical protein
MKQTKLRPRVKDIPSTGDTENSDDQNNNEVEDYHVEDCITMPSISTSNKFEALNLLNEDYKLSKEPAGKPVERDVEAKLSPVMDSEDNLGETDLEKKTRQEGND